MTRKLRSLASAVLSALALSIPLAGCSSSPSAASSASAIAVATACDAGAPGAGFEVSGICSACDGGAPSYSKEIQAILQNECVPCHSPSGTAGFDETTYAEVYNQFGSMLSQVNYGEMPPANGPQMTNTERVALTSWLVCSAPDN